MFKVNNRNTTSRCSNLTVKTPKRRQLCRSCISIVNFEYILHLVFLCVDFEQENIGWVIYKTNRLICFLASKIQNKYYENLKNKEHKITIKNFWKTIKPSLFDNLEAKDRVHLVEKDEIVKLN